jgi:IMP dehydrogenase
MDTKRSVDAFMAAMPHTGITFDDISLVPRLADFLPKDTDIASRLTARINVSIPFVSAAMDTVTESKMAIAMAMLGGIGIIHKNLEIAQQSREVEVVKHYLNGLIRHPITFRTTDTLGAVFAVKAEKKFNFSGFPILDADGKLAGILTAADIKFVRDPNIQVSQIMTRPVITAGPGATIEQAYAIMRRHKIGKLPLVN